MDTDSKARERVVKNAIQNPLLFQPHELRYISNRFPFPSKFALMWAEAIGDRRKMAEKVKSSADGEIKSAFAKRFSTYKKEIRNSLETAREAFFWAKRFPEDSGEVIGLVQGGKWAVHWAEHIGDEDLMKSRIDLSYWELQFRKQVEDKKPKFVA